MRPAESVDVPVSVPFVHRLRFTRDVLGDDARTLSDSLEPSGDGPARVQLWIDDNLAAARPDLRPKLEAFARSAPRRMVFVPPTRVVPGGERIKNDVRGLERILEAIHSAGLDRRSYMVVVGGGAVLDAIGFAAAIAHRGIRLVRLPATTLSQADSGVGVKNSLNLFGKKNWLGTFAVPWAVINDSGLLATLPDRDFVSGFSEVLKVSLLKDPALFDAVCRDAPRVVRRDMEAANPLIAASAMRHLEHIALGGDPFEAREARPLDFGHWSAHKLESLTDFDLRHGEAVGIGVALDSVYSSLVLGFPQADCERVLGCLEGLGLPLDHPALRDDPERLFAGIEEFRQHLGGRLTVTMLRGVGDPLDVHDVDRAAMLEAIRRLSVRART